MSFTLKPTDKDIDKVLALLLLNISGLSHRDTLCIEVYGSIDSISDRKIRLCITALQEKGYLIYSDHGYQLAGDDPDPVIHYLNGLYSRANKLTKKADNMFHELKRKYGDEVAKRVECMPGQPALDKTIYPPTAYPPLDEKNKFHTKVYTRYTCSAEPPFHKSYDTKGNEIDA